MVKHLAVAVLRMEHGARISLPLAVFPSHVNDFDLLNSVVDHVVS